MKLSTAKTRWLSLLLFALAFAYFGIDMKWGDLLEQNPWGIHQWRQTDGASMALLFYEEGHPIYQPHIHNQLHSNGEAGGELPLLYFTAGKLYHLIGVDDRIIRWMNLSIVAIGLLSFLWVINRYLRQALWGIAPILLAIASPTFMYYSANYLPDAGGFGLALIGTACLLSDGQHPNRNTRFLGFFFFLLTGWVKVSMLIPFIAFVGSTFLLGIIDHSKRKNLVQWILGTGIVLLLVFGWYAYIARYNAQFSSTYFATGIRPIWNIDAANISKVWHQFFDQWIVDVIPTWMRWSTLGAILLMAIRWRSLPLFWRLWLPLNVLGVSAYLLLFYANLYEHDYYFLPIYFPILFLNIAGALLLDDWQALRVRPWAYWTSFVLCAVITYGSIAHAVKRNKKTYFGWYRDLDAKEGFLTIAQFLDEKGVNKSAKCFVAQDFSSNQRLYFLRRKGWTQLSGVYNSDQLDPLVDRGVEYAVVPDTSFYAVTFLNYHIIDTVGIHEGIGVYRIGHSRWWNGKGQESTK